MRPLKTKFWGNVYEGSLNTIFFVKLNFIVSLLIYESLRKKWRVQCCPIVKCKLWLSSWMWKVLLGQTEICRRLSNVYGAGNVMSLRHIYKCINHFNPGQSDMHDEQQTGRSWDLINDEMIACVRTLLAIVGSQFQTFAERWQSAT